MAGPFGHEVRPSSGIGFAIEDFNPSSSASIAADGTFSARFEDRADRQTFTYDGKISPDGTASGKLRYTDLGSGFNLSVCNGAGPWTARRGRT